MSEAKSTPTYSAPTYYTLLSLHPSASAQEIRRAYRELSKLYHPDTTTLPEAIARDKFHQINEAYATLTSPERRIAYDLKIGYSRVPVMQSRLDLNRPVSRSRPYRSSAYLDPTDRPLSPGELFALLMIGITFAVCVALVIFVALTRGDEAFQPLQSFQSEDMAIYNLSPPSTYSSQNGDNSPQMPRIN